jgi:hypothetical protein
VRLFCFCLEEEGSVALFLHLLRSQAEQSILDSASAADFGLVVAGCTTAEQRKTLTTIVENSLGKGGITALIALNLFLM